MTGYSVVKTVETVPFHSVESRAPTHLASIGLGIAAFIPIGGPQAHGNSKPGIASKISYLI